MKELILLYTTFFYLGYSPVAPGTVGTFGGVLLYLALYAMGLGWGSYIFIVLALSGLGIWASTRAEEFLGEKDASPIVIDEVLGFLVTMFLIPLSWKSLLIGFVINRVLDIWKPFPARQVQNLPGGWGIVLDDLITGVYTNLTLRVILWFWMDGLSNFL